MNTHKIVARDGGFRIEATTATGKHWVLTRLYPTEAAALVRLRALHAMADAELPEFRSKAHHARDAHV
jgi:hypothetical protein